MFTTLHIPTIGVEVHSKDLDVDNYPIKLQIVCFAHVCSS